MQPDLFTIGAASAKPATRSGNQFDEWRETLQAGADWLRTDTDKKPTLREALPACATSNTADVWLIGAWNAYHGTGEIDYIHKGRGLLWKIKTTRGESMLVHVSNPYDHRDGITVDAWT